MKGFCLALGLALVAMLPLQSRAERPVKPTAVTTDDKLKNLAWPCPERSHVNDDAGITDGDRDFCYRPFDLYEDCADEMDALVKTKEPVDNRLLQMAEKGASLPERYRAAWVLVERRNAKVVSALEKMTESQDTEERYLAWHLYHDAISSKKFAPPQSFDAAVTHYKNEKNSHVREQITYFFGAGKAKDAVPLLLAAIQEDNFAAVHALGEIRDPKTVPAIIAQAKKKTWNRDSYFRALGKIGTPEAVDYLIECLDEGCFAVEALFESGSEKALPAIEKYLAREKKSKKPDELDLAVAQVCVLRLKHADPREHLMKLVESSSSDMQSHAIQALGEYDTKPFAKRILKLYRAEKKDGTQMFFIRLLSKLPGDDITEALIDQALTDNMNEYHFSHNDLRIALNQRLGTSFREMKPLVEHLQRQRETKKK